MPGSAESDSLDDRIAAAFNNRVNSTGVETLIKAAEAASVSRMNVPNAPAPALSTPRSRAMS
jgi:hypothetical protein